MENYNPIILVEKFSRLLYPRVPKPDKNSAIILYRSDDMSKYLLIDEDTGVFSSELRVRKYDMKMTIDLSEVQEGIRFEIPCAEDHHLFYININLFLKVLDPEFIFKERIKNILLPIKNGINKAKSSLNHKYSFSLKEQVKSKVEIMLEEVLKEIPYLSIDSYVECTLDKNAQRIIDSMLEAEVKGVEEKFNEERVKKIADEFSKYGPIAGLLEDYAKGKISGSEITKFIFDRQIDILKLFGNDVPDYLIEKIIQSTAFVNKNNILKENLMLISEDEGSEV